MVAQAEVLLASFGLPAHKVFKKAPGKSASTPLFFSPPPPAPPPSEGLSLDELRRIVLPPQEEQLTAEGQSTIKIAYTQGAPDWSFQELRNKRRFQHQLWRAQPSASLLRDPSRPGSGAQPPLVESPADGMLMLSAPTASSSLTGSRSLSKSLGQGGAHDLAACASYARQNQVSSDAASDRGGEDEEPIDSDAGGDGGRELGGNRGGGHKSKNNPFVAYEDREMRMKHERRWLQQDEDFMGWRFRTLQQETVNAKIEHLGKPSTKGVGKNCGAIGNEWVMEVELPAVGPKKKGPGLVAAMLEQAASGRREVAPSVKSLKGLQKELLESKARVERAAAGKGDEPAKRHRSRRN